MPSPTPGTAQPLPLHRPCRGPAHPGMEAAGSKRDGIARVLELTTAHVNSAHWGSSPSRWVFISSFRSAAGEDHEAPAHSQEPSFLAVALSPW